ncbi:hypothetical protein [Nonomuraea sp. NEAU-A123]|uniref:hypothetical protein n=1 Tax=Nonomuraea sp. NEAU-A123 TaxID=2839649 RepID=UPI001BE44F70|nr:hypothetical protein [Nonomuraea sp. NEAU-A123]MBT2231025.1 hypothetical protein [Nonomuraea sp. NEAU-A123]
MVELLAACVIGAILVFDEGSVRPCDLAPGGLTWSERRPINRRGLWRGLVRSGGVVAYFVAVVHCWRWLINCRGPWRGSVRPDTWPRFPQRSCTAKLPRCPNGASGIASTVTSVLVS